MTALQKSGSNMSGSAGSEAPEEPSNVTVPSALVARKLWLLVGMMKYAKEIDELDSLLLLRIFFYFYAFFQRWVRLVWFIWWVLQSGAEGIWRHTPGNLPKLAGYLTEFRMHLLRENFSKSNTPTKNIATFEVRKFSHELAALLALQLISAFFKPFFWRGWIASTFFWQLCART